MMKTKKISILIFVIGVLFLVTGCSHTEATADGVIKCTRTGEIDNGSSDMTYEVYYEGDYITILHSVEGVTSEDSDLLDQYEDAYKKIFKSYDGIEHCDYKISRNDNSVSVDSTVNYAEVDMDAILDIEGNEMGLIKNGKIKLDTWLTFAKKYGADCDD